MQQYTVYDARVAVCIYIYIYIYMCVCVCCLLLPLTQVTARLTGITRPVITLSEAVSSSELEQLLMLTCNIECNHGSVSWGGSWAGHAITCLLQDVLEGSCRASYVLIVITKDRVFPRGMHVYYIDCEFCTFLQVIAPILHRLFVLPVK